MRDYPTLHLDMNSTCIAVLHFTVTVGISTKFYVDCTVMSMLKGSSILLRNIQDKLSRGTLLVLHCTKS